MTLTAIAIAVIALTAMVLASGIKDEACETIALIGGFQFCLLILACIATVALFIGALWTLYAFGFY